MTKCHYSILARVEGPRSSTNACGTVTAQLDHPEHQKTKKGIDDDATRPPSATFFGSLISQKESSFRANCASHGAAGRTRFSPTILG
jgi:hypothetical protein